MSDADGERGRCCLSGLYGVLVVSSAIAAAVVDLLVTEEADIVANRGTSGRTKCVEGGDRALECVCVCVYV